MWSEIIACVLGGGGVVSLVVTAIINRKQRKEEVKNQQVHSVADVVEYGIPMINIYNEIDKIVESKTAPILAKLDKAVAEIDALKKDRCYRRDCRLRIHSENDVDADDLLDLLNEECRNLICPPKR